MATMEMARAIRDRHFESILRNIVRGSGPFWILNELHLQIGSKAKVFARVIDCVIVEPVEGLHDSLVSTDSMVSSATDAGALFPFGIIAPGVTTPGGAMGGVLCYDCRVTSSRFSGKIPACHHARMSSAGRSGQCL